MSDEQEVKSLAFMPIAVFLAACVGATPGLAMTAIFHDNYPLAIVFLLFGILATLWILILNP